MNNQKGLLYEKFIKDFIIKRFNKQVYLWNECPEEILIDNNLVSSHNHLRIIRKNIKEGHKHHHKDIGIDLIQMEDNDISLIQAKNGYSKGVRVEDLAGIMMRTSFSRKNSYIYYTHNLSINIIKTGELSNYVRFIEDINEIPEKTDANIHFVHLPISKSKKEIPKKIINPYDYQLEAINKFHNHFIENKRGILSLPCGCGKTLTSYKISNKFNKIVFISPLREFALQNLNKFIEYGYKNNYLLINTDGTRNIEEIKQFLKDNEKCLLSLTYKSVDIISNHLDLFENTLFIIDEFHNITHSNLIDETNDMYKLLHSNHKILFMSATPRIYDIENEDYDKDYFENILGNIVYSINFNEAIANKLICDYKIWLPSISENNSELDKELSIYDIENSIKNRCKFLYSCILNNGSRKIIIYTRDKNDMNEMMNAIKTLNEFFILNIEINSICCDNDEKERKEIIKNFSNNNDKIQLLLNVKILNECIDIPSCDSIYISYPPTSKITTIQRCCRATRIDPNNPYKIANIFIYCDEYEEILNTLSIFKEYDLTFNYKIKLNKLNYYNSREAIDNDLIAKDNEKLSNYIINCKEYIHYTFEEKLKELEDAIKIYKRFPTQKENSRLNTFIKTNNKAYKNNKLKDKYKQLWEEFEIKYKDLFYDNFTNWMTKFNELKEYVEKNNEIPKYKTQLNKWFSHQKADYRDIQHIMKNEKIRNIWKNFIDENPTIYLNNIEIWHENFQLLKEFIRINKVLPTQKTNDKLATWKGGQLYNYKNNAKTFKDNDELKKIWDDFIEENKKLFDNNYVKWFENFEKVKEFINTKNKIPSTKNKEETILHDWLLNNKYNYRDDKKSMKNSHIKNE